MHGSFLLVACRLAIKRREPKGILRPRADSNTGAGKVGGSDYQAYEVELTTGEKFTVLTTEAMANMHNAIVERFQCQAISITKNKPA